MEIFVVTFQVKTHVFQTGTTSSDTTCNTPEFPTPSTKPKPQGTGGNSGVTKKKEKEKREKINK
jgi:hypothetical protein